MANIRGPKTTMTVQRATDVSDSLGGITSTWATLTTIVGVLTAGGNTSARFVGNEPLMKGRPTATSSLMFFCDVPSDITITEKDRLTLDTRTFDIITVYNPGNMNHHLELSLFEVK